MSVPKVSAESLQHPSKGVENSRSFHFLATSTIETIGKEGGSVIK